MKTALLVDGTALFLASRALERDRNLDYVALEDKLRESARLKAFDLSLFFTTYDPNNDGQAKFLSFIEDRVGWTIDRVQVSEAAPRSPSSPGYDAAEARPIVRFDARIAFCLGRLAGEYEHVVVVSDSYGIAAPILETIERETKVTLAFFGQMLDARWGRYIHRAAKTVEWIDLDKHTPELFGGEIRKEATQSGLRRLP